MSRASASAGSASAAAAAAALPFLSCDAQGHFHLQPDAVALLNKIKGNICPVVVCGPYRTGKSTLLNLLLDRNVKSGGGAFAVGGTVQACTKGMWMWGEPLVVDDRTYVFFDSEGLGSTDQHATFDTQLFSLSLLLSSLFVLNTSGTINEGALEQLELVVQLTERIKVGSKGGKGAAGAASAKEGEGTLASLAHFFPSFLWVLRDFTLELRSAQGQLMSPNDYLEDALRPVPVGPNAKRGAAEKNRIRSAISQVFPVRECVTLVRPVAEERDLARVSQLANDSLRGEFRRQIAALKELIPRLAPPKSIDGVALSGRAFTALAASYVGSINRGSVPQIRTAFQSVQEIQGREAQDAAWGVVQRRVQELVESKGGEHVWPEAELEALLESIRGEALALIREQALGSSEDIERLGSQFLSKHVTGLFSSLRERNNARAEKHCGATIASLWEEAAIEEHLPSFETYEQLNKCVSGFWGQYLKLTTRRGVPQRVQVDVGRAFLDQKREGIFKHLFARLARGAEELRVVQRANEENQAAVSRITTQLREAQMELQVAARKAEVEVEALRREVASKEKEGAGMEKRMRQLEQQVAEERARTAQEGTQAAQRVAQLDAQVRSLSSDLTRLEQDKSSLAAQLHTASSSLAAATASASSTHSRVGELTAEMEQLRREHSRELKALQQAHEKENLAADIQAQRDADAREAHAVQLRATEKELEACKAQVKSLKSAKARGNEEAEGALEKLRAQVQEQEEATAQLQQQIKKERAEAAAEIKKERAAAAEAAAAAVAELKQERAAAAAALKSARAAAAASSSDNPLGLPAPTHESLISRKSLIPSKFSSGAGGAGVVPPSSKRKSAAASAAHVSEEDEDMDMGGGGDAYGEDEVEEEEEEDESEEEEAPPVKKKAPAAAKKSAAPAAAAAAPAPSLSPSSLRDPNSMTIGELKSWLTSLDISFPQKSQPKAWYVDLAYEKIGSALEEQFPRAAKAKKAKK